MQNNAGAGEDVTKILALIVRRIGLGAKCAINRHETGVLDQHVDPIAPIAAGMGGDTAKTSADFSIDWHAEFLIHLW